MTIPPPAGYQSRFLKADRRPVLKAQGSQTYRTTFEQHTRLDDLFLLPGASAELDTAGLTGPLLVLPIVGGALLTTGRETEKPLVPGCIYTIPVQPGQPLTLTNPFAKETVNILLLQVPLAGPAAAETQEFELPLTAKNVLVSPPGPALPVRVGVFDSRIKGRITTRRLDNFSLCYVLNGSFEIEDRLVEHRDALLLWETPQIDFESLSETAILFHLEFAG